MTDYTDFCGEFDDGEDVFANEDLFELEELDLEDLFELEELELEDLFKLEKLELEKP